jgi:Purple acid Phosphatase, N-terminal domain
LPLASYFEETAIGGLSVNTLSVNILLQKLAITDVRLNRGHPETIFRVRVDGLKPRTTYYYTVTSMESNGKSDGVMSPVNQFTTPGPGERIVAYPPQPR